MNDDQIETGPEGNPIIHDRKALNEILTGVATVDDLNAVEPGPGMTIPVTSRKLLDEQVEMVPGIMVSQRLIDEAVRMTTNPLHPTAEVLEAARERDLQRRAKENAELREDLDKSRDIVLQMINRMREPLKYDEKFISFDTMPAPLQRVIKAYIDVEAANRELAEAVASLGKDLLPTTHKPE